VCHGRSEARGISRSFERVTERITGWMIANVEASGDKEITADKELLSLT